ncbi:MAG: phenylalanine--tRNA ligase subunit alpha [Thermoplasmata archaeon]|nr:phenylalanine--tRNA ligase subunit alpha [Thermoplasmata archaeon]
MADPPDDPGPAASAITLSDSERRLLVALRDLTQGPASEEELAATTGLPADHVRGSLQRLRSKHLAVVDEQHASRPVLTARGRAAQEVGLPERRLLRFLTDLKLPIGPEDLPSGLLTPDERSPAIGLLRRYGYLAEGVPLRLRPESPPASTPLPDEIALEAVASGGVDLATAGSGSPRRRGLVEVERTTARRWAASEEGRQLPMAAGNATLQGAVTPALLRDGGWEDAAFRPYDVRATVPFVTGPRPHPYATWLRQFEEILVGLGFSEARGPLLETEFWNGDVLFMPQEHPARSIHDVLSVEGVVGHPPAADLLEKVAAAHEGRPLPGESRPMSPGWRASYDRAFAARPVLRSQTTAVSARFMAANPEPPFRVYCLDRNFRRDAVDATHHIEFAQCEGILGEEGVTLRHLVGVFQALTDALGLGELKIRPSYFPFTEPSIEGYVRHPRLGWIEVFPGGLFRPEVLRPLGVRVPVAAWGIGVMRLAMIALGVDDIRQVYDDDLGRLRGEES